MVSKSNQLSIINTIYKSVYFIDANLEANLRKWDATDDLIF